MPDGLTSVVTGLIGLALGHFSGVLLERRKQSLVNRRELVEPVQQWLDTATSLVGIVADDVVTIAEGQPVPVGYTLDDRTRVGRHLNEMTPRVKALMDSRALHTLGTRRLSGQLAQSVNMLSDHLEKTLLPLDLALVERGASRADPTAAISGVTPAVIEGRTLLRRAYAQLDRIKVRLA
jgi:hypothetical protein